MNDQVTFPWSLLKNFMYLPAALVMGLDSTSYKILAVFMALDLFLGVVRAVYFGGGPAFKSYKLSAGVLSKLLVTSVPLILVWAGKGAGIDLAMLAQWSVGTLILSQAYSMLGHINSIRLGQDTAEWDAMSVVFTRLRRVLEDLLIDTHSKKD